MTKDLVTTSPTDLACAGTTELPAAVVASGDAGMRRFIEFFTVTIRNKNTRQAYAQAVKQFFDWCEMRGVQRLEQITPVVVAGYIEQHKASAPTVKQHLAAVRMLFDWLVTGHVVPHNPATSVRGPKHVVKRGKTPVLTADERRDSLSTRST